MSGRPRPLRADAQRNFDSIVTAASDAFASEGTEASLDDIADRAGVGNATLYRHFPHRDALLVEAMRARLVTMDAVARELASNPDAGLALSGWFYELATHLHAWRGLPTAVVDALRRDASPLKSACAPLQLRTQMFLMKAQDAGAARADLTADEIFALIATLSWAADRFADTEPELRRRIDIAFSGVNERGSIR